MDDFAQRRRWRAFKDARVEADYRVWHREEILPVARLVGVIAAVFWAGIPLFFALYVGSPPRALYISTWVIGVPVFLTTLALSYTRFVRWEVPMIVMVAIVLGLDLVWTMTSMYGPGHGAVTAGALSVIFFPLVLRLPTGGTALVTLLIPAVPVTQMISGVRRGDISLVGSWPYLAVLLTNSVLVIVAAAQIEAGMRRQFAALRTVARQQRLLEASQRLIRRYAPAAVAARIESGDAEAVGVPQRLRVTALSSDIAGFTVLADRLDPESLSQVINEYVGAMSDVIEGHQGVVTEFAGDGLMAIFGAPERLEPAEQVRAALAAASGMHDRLAELNESWPALGIEQSLHVRVGINTGVLSVGTFGSDGRATYTAIGLQMNIAARIQAHCEPGSILLSKSSWHLVKDEVDAEPLGEVTVKGVHFPINVYSPRLSG